MSEAELKAEVELLHLDQQLKQQRIAEQQQRIAELEQEVERLKSDAEWKQFVASHPCEFRKLKEQAE